MSASSPDPVNARLSRADIHVADLRALVDEFVARPPYTTRRTIRADRPGWVIDRAELRDSVPIQANMILSDAIHQARAALDNLVGTIRPLGPTSDSYFPIRTEAAEFDTAALAALKGLPSWAQDVIRSVQPFAGGGGEVLGRQLDALHRLARIDRHRAPPLQSAFLSPDYAVSKGNTGLEFRTDWVTWAEAEYRPDLVESVHFAVDVRFGPDVPVVGDMEVVGTAAFIIASVREVVRQLASPRSR